MNRREFLSQSAQWGKRNLAKGPRQIVESLISFSSPEIPLSAIDGKTVFSCRAIPITAYQLGTSRTRFSATAHAIDLCLANPELSEPFHAIEYETDKPVQQWRIVTATIPTVTGVAAHYKARLGYQNDDRHVLSVVIEPDAVATYAMADHFYDNKIVNATTALLALTQSMTRRPIMPGEEFSYLDWAQIGPLLNSGAVVPGFGIDTRSGKKIPMNAGGICSSVTTIAKMARRAEAANMVRIGFHRKHSTGWEYFYNPDDPIPQIDATAYYSTGPARTDFTFTNMANCSLFIVPKVQIIPTHDPGLGYNSLYDSTGLLVFSVTLRYSPPSPIEVAMIEKELEKFRNARGI